MTRKAIPMRPLGNQVYEMFGTKEALLRQGYPSIEGACKKIEDHIRYNDYRNDTLFSIVLTVNKESDTNEATIKGIS